MAIGMLLCPMAEVAQADQVSRWIKHYSPYCGHCKAIAPHWQTMYEYYTTSSPLEPQAKAISSDAPSLNTFDGYYNFHFSSINCVTNGDKCDDHDVKVWPTFVLYKDGKEIDRKEGQMSMEEFMHYTEEKLEQIKPGSRPREGIAIPEPGSTSVDRSKVQKPLAKDKDAEAGKAAGVKHNSVASVQLTATATSMLSHETARYGDPKPTHARPAPNPAGKSIPLTAESFQKLVTSTQDEWFIKFYAPWCTHCQALAPTWAQMAKENAGKLNIGEVNCDAEPRLCKDARVKAYPTIYFFRGGERVEYDGLRGLGDLLGFTKKALDSDVKYVNASGFKEMEETEEVIFVFFFDHGTTSEDFAALDRLTLSLIGHAKIVKTDSAQLAQRFRISTWPRLMVSRDGRASFFTPLAPKDVRDFRQVLTWMQSVWLPVVPELSASNAQEILNGRLVVLGILDRNRKDEFTTGKRELKNAALEWMEKTTREFQAERQEMRDAKQLRIEEAEDRNDQRALRQAKSRTIAIKEEDFRKPVGFAWVDGIFWERWIRTTYGIDVSKGERVIINDEDVSSFQPNHQAPSINTSRILTLSVLEPPILRANRHGPPDRPLPHLHPRNPPPRRRRPAQTQAQNHHRHRRALLLPDPHLRVPPSCPRVRVYRAAGGGGGVRGEGQGQCAVESGAEGRVCQVGWEGGVVGHDDGAEWWWRWWWRWGPEGGLIG